MQELGRLYTAFSLINCETVEMSIDESSCLFEYHNFRDSWFQSFYKIAGQFL